MSLTPVMGLVIEPMRQGGSQFLHELLGARDTPIGNRSGNTRIVQPFDIGYDPGIFRHAGHSKRIERLAQDRIQPIRRIALAGKTLHPDSIRRQQMIERAVDRFEKGAAVGPVIRLAETARGLIQPRVRPCIVVPSIRKCDVRPLAILCQPAAVCRATTRLRNQEPTAQPRT